MGWWTDLKRGAGDVVTNPVTYISPVGGLIDTVTGGNVGDKVKDVGRDTVRDVPVLGKVFGQESSEEIAARKQTEAIDDARGYQERMYGEAKGYLDPYRSMGDEVLFGKQQYRTQKVPSGFNPFTKEVTYKEIQVPIGRSGGLQDRILGGDFVQDDFSYSGTQPQFSYSGQQPEAFKYGGPSMMSKVAYEGQQVDPFSYSGQGQQGQLDYTGKPIDRSIESYMQDDPSLAWQQEQMEKAINRQGAAKGRWGGGATAREMMRETSGLLSQDYGNRFQRAAQERGAAVGAERDTYGRSLTALDLMNQAEQSQYGRTMDKYGLDVDRERDAYGRSLTDTQMGNLAAQDAYNRAQYGYQTGVDRERDAYGRSTQQYGFDRDREQQQYGRVRDEYELNQLTELAKYGPQMSQAMANAALGQGTSLSDLAIQQGNVNAASTMAQGNQFGKLLDMLGKGAEVYGASQGM
jgi:hypothetical protein